MIDFGVIARARWEKDGASLPVATLPIEKDGEVVATVEVWADLRLRPDGKAYLVIGHTDHGFAVIEAEELERIGFRSSMKIKGKRPKKGTPGS